VRYALDHPDRVVSVVGVAGHGLHKDRSWSQTYAASRHLEDDLNISWEPGVCTALNESFVEWIHEPDLLRRLADSDVPITFMAAEHDIRPSWPLRQLAALVRDGTFKQIPGVDHNLWSSHPPVWVDHITMACHGERTGPQGGRAVPRP
jgi:proline iminopeptidase